MGIILESENKSIFTLFSPSKYLFTLFDLIPSNVNAITNQLSIKVKILFGLPVRIPSRSSHKSEFGAFVGGSSFRLMRQVSSLGECRLWIGRFVLGAGQQEGLFRLMM